MIPAEPTQPEAWSEENSQTFIQYGRYFIPDRESQLSAIVKLIPYLETEHAVIDLCCGEGFLSEAILQKHPACRVTGLDGSNEMLNQAARRLARFGERFQALQFDLFQRHWPEIDLPVQAVVSSLAIHHLGGAQKQALFKEILGLLAPGGTLIVADIVEPAHKLGWELAAEEWDEAVRQRAVELDGTLAAFHFFEDSQWNMYRYFDPEDIDRPSRLYEQLKWLEQTGFKEVDVHWMRAGHAIYSGYKSG